MKLSWKHKDFNELTLEELYKIIKLRVDVFVNEQQCFYPELDDKDYHCSHLWSEENGEIIAYARLVPPTLSYPEPSIGRVITSPNFRNQKIGSQLIQKSIELLVEKQGTIAIQIGAQVHLKRFYENFGFQQVSDEYPDYGIMHIDMIRPK